MELIKGGKVDDPTPPEEDAYLYACPYCGNKTFVFWSTGEVSCAATDCLVVWEDE